MLTVKTDYSLKAHNSFGLDVKARHFVEYESAEDLAAFLRDTDVRNSRMVHIGSGSDLLFTKDYDGYIVHSAVRGKKLIQAKGESVLLSVGAGENWDDLVDWTISNGYYGLENLSLIPSEVGAAAVQNIGAYGAEVKDFIVWVDCLDLESCDTVRFRNAECGFSYRNSNFKSKWQGRYAIIEVAFELSTAFKPNLSYRALKGVSPEGLTPQALRQAVIDIRRSKLPEPEEIGNAGSFFMNPVITAEQYAQLYRDYPDMPHFDVEGGVKVPAAWLIEQCGWKGRNIGAAGVYERHPLVIVNLGGATPQDIINVADAVVGSVREKFGISLKPEVIWI
ncbi:MAG: UDP-N-acetylmuramate dehydrogenase [Bacteroidaceae bacterium]|nr:UDP-N-acetylmuramate dehydrogenase [Bacteroidaceae bacterium]